jgi:hypothetical protein
MNEPLRKSKTYTLKGLPSVPVKTKAVFNEPLYREVQKQIARLCDRVDMTIRYWNDDMDDDIMAANDRDCARIMDLEDPDCKTIACIAGFTLAVAGVAFDWKVGGVGFDETARELLGLTPTQARRLFYLAFWPPDYITAYNQEKADAVIAYMDHYAGEVKAGRIM